jgi:hypothetical protein
MTVMVTMAKGKRVLWLGLLLGALPGAGAGCGGSTSSGSGSGSVARSDLPDALARTICANVGPCCQSAGKPFDQGKCQTVLSQIYKSAQPQADAGAYNAQASGPCLDAVGAAVQKCNFGKGATPASAACEGVFGSSRSGTKGKAGDPCDTTCTETGSSSSCSSFGSGSRSGVDAATSATPVARVTCYTNDGVYCDSGRSVCRAQVAIGAACSSDEACVASWCQRGKCAAFLGEGGGCNGSSRACLAALYCDYAANTCSKKKADGAACQISSECQSESCRTQKCASSSSVTDSFLALACTG